MYGDVKEKKPAKRRDYHAPEEGRGYTTNGIIAMIISMKNSLREELGAAQKNSLLSHEALPRILGNLQQISTLLRELTVAEDYCHRKIISQKVNVLIDAISSVRRQLEIGDSSSATFWQQVSILLDEMNGFSSVLPLSEIPEDIRSLSLEEIQETLQNPPLVYKNAELPPKMVNAIAELLVKIWNNAKEHVAPEEKSGRMMGHTLVQFSSDEGKILKASAMYRYSEDYIVGLYRIFENLDEKLSRECLEQLQPALGDLRKNGYSPHQKVPMECIHDPSQDPCLQLMKEISQRMQIVRDEPLTDLFSNIVSQISI